MGSTRSVATGHGVVDIEAGPVDAASIKAAGVVAESYYDSREQSRVEATLADRVVDVDPDRNRAARDRDRAFPRDVSQVDDPRKQRRLPAPGEFRGDLSSRQRKDRSAAKRRVLETAPRSGVRELQRAVGDPGRWAAVNTALRGSAGNAQDLDPGTRRSVQRLDRMIQHYERSSGRGHVVYAVVELPTDQPITRPRDVPETLQPGARISFDQYTMCSHTLDEAATAVERRRAAGSTATPVILEIETSRGMYLGRSDSVSDTTHVLPRGMGLHVAGIDPHADYARPGRHDSTLVVQLRESERPTDYTPPVTGRRVFRDRRAAAAARAAAREKEPRRDR